MKRTLLALVASVAVAGGCSSSDKSKQVTEPTPEPGPTTEPAPAMTPDAAEPDAAPPAPTSASATLQPAPKGKVKGTFTFKQVEDGVEVTATIEGLKAGEHGFHVHETGDCSAADFASAGAHFNPGGHPHGAPEAEHRHDGDFGNLKAGKDGKATKTFVMKGITLADGANGIIGKAMIVHEKKDDLKSQPSGNAGARLACGVIAADAS